MVNKFLLIVSLLGIMFLYVASDENFPADALIHANPIYKAMNKRWPSRPNYMDKRGYNTAPFSCNGNDHMPRCLNGGKGPRRTWLHGGFFCICLCRAEWYGPECAYPTSNAKRWVSSPMKRQAENVPDTWYED